MKRSALVIAAAMLGLSASAMAQQLEWVNGQGDSSGYWKPAEYRVVDGRLARVDPSGPLAPRVARPALSYDQLVAESESDARFTPSQPTYRRDGGRLALQNPAPATPRERTTMTAIERLYRDFASG